MRSKLFMRIIAYISFSDFCGNVPYTITKRPSDGSIWCTIQGFMNLYFYPVSWIWTTILVYFLYSFATKGRLPLSEGIVNCFGWGIPIFTTLLILTTNRYDRYSDDDQYEVCTIGGKNLQAAFIWHIVSYYGLFLLCVLIMVILYARIFKVKLIGKTAVSVQMLQLASQSLQLYPLAMIICWLPEIVAFWIQQYNDDDDFYHIAIMMKLSNGIFTSIIFFYNSQNARRLWISLITGTVPIPRYISKDSSSAVSAASHTTVLGHNNQSNIISAASKSYLAQSYPESTEAYSDDFSVEYNQKLPELTASLLTRAGSITALERFSQTASMKVPILSSTSD